MRTLYGAYPNGFRPNGAFGDDPLTIASGGSISSVNDGIALDCQSPFKNFAFYWDVTNYGRITAQGFPSTGVVLQDGGSLVNGASTATGAYISGSYRGISMPDGGGAVVNYGTIAVSLENSVGVYLPVGGNVKNFGLIRGPGTEIEIGGAGGTVANYGTVGQASAGTGIYLPNGGTVINGSSAARAASIATGAEGFGVEAFNGAGIINNSGTIAAGFDGILLNSGGTITNSGSVLGAEIAINLGGSATLTNRGTIFGNGTASFGVVFNASTGGDFLSNAGTGDIAGTKFGVYANVGSMTVVNTARIENGVVLKEDGKVTNGRSGSTRGHITGAAFGVYMPRGGTLVNFGMITGYGMAGIGVSLEGPLAATTTAASTVTNAGTITGAGGTAIAFGDGNDRLIVDAGAKFDDVVSGAGGANEIDFRKTGTMHLDPEYVGFSIVRLGNGAADRLSLSELNFTAIAGNAITVYGGNAGSTVDADGFAGKHRLLYFGTRGKDRVTGGGGNDRFTFAAPGLTAADAIAGNGGSDAIAITTGGTLNPAGVTGVETVRLAGAEADSLVLTDGNFVGVAGHTITLFGGRAGDTIDAAKLSAANRIVAFGGRGPDQFTGGAGNDRFSVAAMGLTSADHIAGGAGLDELDLTGAGSSALAGISGIETIRLSGAAADTVVLGNGNFAGINGNVVTVIGGSTGDTVFADTVAAAHRVGFVGGAGSDLFFGGNGNDTFRFAAANLTAADTVQGAGGSDRLTLTTGGTASAIGVNGIETYALAAAAADTITLGNGNFAGITGSAITVIAGGAGDTVDARAVQAPHRVVFVGGAGADLFTGGAGADTFESTTTDLGSNDRLRGAGGSDRLVLESSGTIANFGVFAGIETIVLASAGRNTLVLKDGNFGAVTGRTITVLGGNVGNTIDASALTGTNRIIAVGGTGSDRFKGGEGADTLTAGGHAAMTGGGGADVFVFKSPGTAANRVTNRVADFTRAQGDKLAFSNSGFHLGLSKASTIPKALSSGLFSPKTNGTFDKPGERFAYDNSTGRLYSDADGSDASDHRQLVATVANHPAIGASNLFFVL